MIKIGFPLRLDPENIVQLRKLATKRYLQVGTMVRMWIMERLEKELRIEEAKEKHEND